MRNFNFHGKDGFSLLEALLSLTIVSLAFLAIFDATSSNIKGLKRIELSSMAALYSQSARDMVGTIFPLEEGKYTHTFDSHYDAHMNIRQLDAYSQKKGNIELYIADIQIFHPDFNGPLTQTSTTLIKKSR